MAQDSAPDSAQNSVQESALWVIGCGYVGQALLRAAPAAGYAQRYGTTRSADQLATLTALAATPLLLTDAASVPTEDQLRGAHVVVTYPPDSVRDNALAARCGGVQRLVYISSTAVYGGTRGHVDDDTPTAPNDPVGEARARAERVFLDAGAVVLRAPGIYGPERGLHMRLPQGRFHFTGQGDNHISRIHVDDLVGLSLCALQRGRPGVAHVVGDLQPTTQREAVTFLCEHLDLPLPPSQPAETAHRTLRGDRQVNPQKALAALGYNLRFPSYREGFVDAMTRSQMRQPLDPKVRPS